MAKYGDDLTNPGIEQSQIAKDLEAIDLEYRKIKNPSSDDIEAYKEKVKAVYADSEVQLLKVEE